MNGITGTFEKRGISVVINERSFCHQRLCFGADFSHSVVEKNRAIHSDSRAHRWGCFLCPVSGGTANPTVSRTEELGPGNTKRLLHCLPPASALLGHSGAVTQSWKYVPVSLPDFASGVGRKENE